MEQSIENFEGTKNVFLGGSSDLEVGIQLIYDMKHHIPDFLLATIYFFVCYAIFLWLTKKIKG
jgi:hypothetical protein|tara:strand:- start:314 stop:502 length:189 start_codon:yes stop_codon:yes gene_type:complete